MDPESEAAANGDADNSDDDVDSEIFNGAADDVEPPSSSTSRLKRSIRHIRSNKEAIKGSLRKAKETTKDKMFGRSKRPEVSSTTTTITANEKEPLLTKPSADVDIESGVEMVEDMVITASVAAATKTKDPTRRQVSDNDGDDNGTLVSYFYQSAEFR